MAIDRRRPRLREPSTDPIERLDSSDHRDACDSTEPVASAEPMDSTEPTDPQLPIDSTDPTLAIDRIDPREPIDIIESCDHSDHRELAAETLIRSCSGIPDRRNSGLHREPHRGSRR